ncbi:MAG TPA: DUF992 domain-containing protein [Caulobacteraceae bacterium]|jgi:hypothetical protein
MKATLLSLAGALAIGVPALAPALAHAEGGVQVGTLSCQQQSGWGYVLGSSRRVSCLFEGPWGSSRYIGRMTAAGVDVGYHGPSQLVWAVFAPTNRIGPGALAGQYGGATAGAAVGVGLSGNGLIGGSDRTIQLQPFSVTGNTGLSATVGIAGMTLFFQPRSVAFVTPAPRARAYVHHRAYVASPPPPPPRAVRIPRG